MTERDHAGGGGLTGATGDLTFEENDRPFVPGETKEMTDPAHQADVTASQIRHAPAQAGVTGDPEAQPEGGPTNLATRDEGHASTHGLNPDDPVYRMERHPSAGEQGGDPSQPPGSSQGSSGTRVGGDELHEAEEHL